MPLIAIACQSQCVVYANVEFHFQHVSNYFQIEKLNSQHHSTYNTIGCNVTAVSSGAQVSMWRQKKQLLLVGPEFLWHTQINKQIKRAAFSCPILGFNIADSYQAPERFHNPSVMTSVFFHVSCFPVCPSYRPLPFLLFVSDLSWVRPTRLHTWSPHLPATNLLISFSIRTPASMLLSPDCSLSYCGSNRGFSILRPTLQKSVTLLTRNWFCVCFWVVNLLIPNVTPSCRLKTRWHVFTFMWEIIIRKHKMCQSLINHLICHWLSPTQLKPTGFNPLAEKLVLTPLSNNNYCCLPVTPLNVATVLELSAFLTTAPLTALQSSAV